jgi:predicted DsbA family dithiol-disulfide isomerase
MGGLLPGWGMFADNQNSIMRPAQMGPLWMHAGEALGLKIAHRVWVNDPPASSYPACVAVKCAELQSAVAGRHYLHFIRKAIMEHGLNIARKVVLDEVAECIASFTQGFSIARFNEDMQNDKGIEAFRKDLQEVKYRNISRFPTLIIQRPGSRGLMVTGYRPAEVLLKIINELWKTNGI